MILQIYAFGEAVRRNQEPALGVTELFVRDGFPLQYLVAAERACSDYLFWSEREACVQSLLAASYHHQVASR